MMGNTEARVRKKGGSGASSRDRESLKESLGAMVYIRRKSGGQKVECDSLERED